MDKNIFNNLNTEEKMLEVFFSKEKSNVDELNVISVFFENYLKQILKKINGDFYVFTSNNHFSIKNMNDFFNFSSIKTIEKSFKALILVKYFLFNLNLELQIIAYYETSILIQVGNLFNKQNKNINFNEHDFLLEIKEKISNKYQTPLCFLNFNPKEKINHFNKIIDEIKFNNQITNFKFKILMDLAKECVKKQIDLISENEKQSFVLNDFFRLYLKNLNLGEELPQFKFTGKFLEVFFKELVENIEKDKKQFPIKISYVEYYNDTNYHFNFIKKTNKLSLIKFIK